MKGARFLALSRCPYRFKLVYGNYLTRVQIRVDSESACSELPMDTAEKEVQDTSCRGSGGVPQLKYPSKTGGYGG